MLRARPLFVLLLGGMVSVGCAGLLGLDEVTESTPGDGGSGMDGPSTTDGANDDGAPTGDGGADAPPADNDATADADAATDAPIDAFDAGCGAVIATDFTAVAPLPQATEVGDNGSTIVYDLTGVGGSRAMHVKVPTGSTHAELVINVQALGTDGALKCDVVCGVDMKLVQRGSAAIDMAVEGAGLSANISHSSTFTYFSRADLGVEAPDLGTIPLGTFVHLEIDVSGAAAPFAAKATLLGASNTKPIMFFPVAARFGLVKAAADPEVEAVYDRLVCRSRLP